MGNIAYTARSHRLAVRTSDSHSGNTGSIPVGSASSVLGCVEQRRIS